MEAGTLEKKIANLPEDLKLQVEHYVDTLLDVKFKDETVVSHSISKPRPVFGSGKGLFGKMADDFDEPLDEMKDYML